MKRQNGTIDFSHLAPDVAETIRNGQRRMAAKSMSSKQRRDAARNRLVIDIPVELENQLSEIARELGLPISQLIRWLILRGMETSTREEIEDARLPSRSMRYEFILFTTNDTPKRHP